MKRIWLVAFLLLALAVPAWAARTLYPVQSPASMNWSAATWALTDGGAATEVKPAGGDSVIFSANSGDVTLDEDTAALFYFNTPNYAGTLDLATFTLTIIGDCELFGTITGTGTIDSSAGLFWQAAAVADGVTLLLGAAGGNTIWWFGTGGSVNIDAADASVLRSDCNSYALTLTADRLTGNSKTWTVGDGGFEMAGGEVSSTLTVDLSAGTGAYTQTGGEVSGTLNVTTGSGGWTFTALTLTGTLNMTVASSVTAKWDTTTAQITKLTIDPGITLTQNGNLRFVRLDGTGTLAAGAFATHWYPAASTDWSFTGTTTGTGPFKIKAAGDLTFPVALDVGTRPVDTTTIPRTLAFAGLTCGNLTVAPNAGGTTTITINGNSSGAALTVGTALAANRLGAVVFGSGYVHNWTGNIAKAGTGTGHAVTPGGRLLLGGTFTGTDITVTPTYEGEIDCFGVGRVTAVTSTGRRLVVRRAVDAAGMPLRGWEDDSCVNTKFEGRKEIGAPGVN